MPDGAIGQRSGEIKGGRVISCGGIRGMTKIVRLEGYP